MLTKLAAISVVALMSVTSVMAAEFEVHMVNKDSKGRAMSFEPAFLKIQPGDTVKFIPTDKSHNSESILEMTPEGAEPWKGKINQEVTVTFTQEGVYAYKCLPHFAMGMVGLIQVGDTPDPEVAADAKLPGKAKARMEELVAEMMAGGEGAAAPAEGAAAPAEGAAAPAEGEAAPAQQ